MVNLEDIANKHSVSTDDVREAIGSLSGFTYTGGANISNNLAAKVDDFFLNRKKREEDASAAAAAAEEAAAEGKSEDNEPAAAAPKKKIVLKKRKIVLKKKVAKPETTTKKTTTTAKRGSVPSGKPKPAKTDAAKPGKTDAAAPADSGKKPSGHGRDHRTHRKTEVLEPKEESKEKELRYHKRKKEIDYKQRERFEIQITEGITVGELAKKMNVKAQAAIKKLMEMGIMASIPHQLDNETAIMLAEEFNCSVKIISLYDETLIESEKGRPEDYIERPAVVTVMGHVDHGKTQLLDTIRHEDVVAGEAGGITQHIGAYKITVKEKEITFLDTPGHAAFTAMRARGASVTDIIILIVAADDGVMPQTVEAINHAKAADVPIIVAVNKIDLPGAKDNLENIKGELAKHDLSPEDWGGKVQVIPLSALKGDGVDALLGAVLLEAEMLELRDTPNVPAVGTIIESKTDPGRGPVATVLIQRGTLRSGDAYVAGVYSGKARAIFNDKGERIKSASLSSPVEIIGLEGIPDSGDPFNVVSDDKQAKKMSQKRLEYKKHQSHGGASKEVTLDNIMAKIKDGEVKDFNVIIKSDVHGSTEALRDALLKLRNEEIRVNVVHADTGAITETDVTLAATTSSVIIGFHIRPGKKALELAHREKVEIRTYSIIYKCLEDIEAAIEGMLSPDLSETVEGRATIRQIFKISRLGNIAGGYVTSGIFRRNAAVRLLRDGVVIYEGKLASLKRFSEDAKEVKEGFECGFQLDNYNDLKEGDEIETYVMKEVARSFKADAGEKDS